MSRIPATELTLRDGRRAIIRCAETFDAPRVLELLLEVASEETYILTETSEVNFTEEEERGWIASYHLPSGRLILVGEVEGRVEAVIDFTSGNRNRLRHRGVLGIMVSQACREVGLGRALMESVLAWATDDPQIEKVTLSVLADNTRAVSLYKSLGFIEEGRRPRELKLGHGRYLDDILMYRFVK